MTALRHGATVPLHCVCWILYGGRRCGAVRREREPGAERLWTGSESGGFL